MKLRHTRISLAIQGALMLSLLPLAAQAQEAAPDTKTLETIEVTGTRIKGADLAGQVPVQTLTREDIERSGVTSIGDLIQELTGSGSALNTKFNSSGNFGFSPNGDGVGAGSAQVDLRHLGAKRVLVQVDGKRWVNEASASGVGASTDLNTIPLAIVERVEVLEDCASSLYGSDAIAGVVNIITRKNFDGFQVTLNYGEYGEGDGATKGVDVGWGWNTDRSNLFLGLSYTDGDKVNSSDRYPSAIPIQGGSSRVPGGRFFFVHTPDDPATPNVDESILLDLTTNAGLNNPVYDPTQTTCTRTDGFHCFTFGNDAFNYAPFNYVVTPSKRTGLFGSFRFDFTDNVSWYAKALYNRRESTNQAAPEPIDLGPGSGNVWNDNVIIAANNPYNPFGMELNASNIITIRRRPLEGGPRIFEQDVDTKYFGTGVEGSFGGDHVFYWDVNAAYSKNEADQHNYGSYNARHISLALGDPAACAAVAGCTPLDIFGFGTITPEMLAWISPVFHDQSEQTLTQFTANISGDAFPTWAGQATFAAGYEYRKYKGSYEPDPATVAGEYNGVPSLPTSGSYDVDEVYVELNIPLVNEGWWGKKMDFNIAGRYSDYSTFGGEFTPKYGFRWQLADEFTMRATYAEGFRAPSIGELYGSPSRFDALLVDPCMITPGGDPATGNPANCAALGVPVGAIQVDPQISVATGGNANLGPERARSFTAGWVWSPNFLSDVAISDKVDFEVTYYRHTILGAIQPIDAQTQLDLCVATLDPLYCDGISRVNGTGQIDNFDNFLTNLGKIKTSGVDADIFWTLPETSFGRFKVSWQNTFVASYESEGAAGQQNPQGVGVEVNDSGIPEWTSNATLDWKLGAWNASWTVRHISELDEACLADDAAFWCSNAAGGTNHLDAITYHDLQVGYRIDWMKGLNLTAGVRNLFDEDPPVCTSCSLNGYDASTYDIPQGRFWYLRADFRF
jgi:iron complex outermembrane receptor protein